MNELIKKMIIFLFRMMPLRNEIILESHPDFSDNTYALYEYFLQQGVNKRYRIHWALHYANQRIPQLPKNVDTFYLDASGFKNMWNRFRALYCSRYILDSNSYIVKRRKGQIRLHLGHGMLIKITEEYHNAERMGECDGYLVTSPFWNDVLEKKVGVKRSRLLPLGYPRNDVLTDEAKKKNAFGKYIVWMPTFRQHKKDESISLNVRYPYGMPEIMNKEQLNELDEYLQKEDTKLYFRPHPAQDLSFLKEKTLQRIIVADDDFLKNNKITLYELLAASKGLITDYSSVYFDFLLTEKPIGLTMGDREEYFAKYGCAFKDVTKELEGVFIESYEELMGFVKDIVENENNPSEEYLLMRDKCHSVQDGTSAQKIYEYLTKKYGL